MSAFARKLVGTGDWLDRRRVFAYAGVLLAVELALFLFFVAGTHGWIVPLPKPITTDFVSFYAAGDLADQGTPFLAYDQAAHQAAEEAAREPGIQYQFFYYPPVFLLICAALARLPYMVAFIAFEAATLLLYLAVARGILGDRSWPMLVPLLAFPAIFWTLGLGQNAFLTAALFGAATVLVDRRPVASGVLFGLLCYKPHFGLLIPVALAAGRHGRAFAAAGTTAVALVLLSMALFGVDTWRDFLTVADGMRATYASGRIDLAGMVSPFGALRLMGADSASAYAVQAIASVAAAGLVAFAWRRHLSLPVRASLLAAGTLVAVPVALVYDLMLAAVAGAWLCRAGLTAGFRTGEAEALAALFVIPLVARNIADAWHVPLAPLACIALLALAAWRAQREIGARHDGPHFAATGAELTS